MNKDDHGFVRVSVELYPGFCVDILFAPDFVPRHTRFSDEQRERWKNARTLLEKTQIVNEGPQGGIPL
jgi:hypothetical protein